LEHLSPSRWKLLEFEHATLEFMIPTIADFQLETRLWWNTWM